MIRIILVAMTVILYLIFSVPLLAVLRFRAKTDPVGVQKVSLGKIQGVFRFILKLAGVTYEVQGDFEEEFQTPCLVSGFLQQFSGSTVPWILSCLDASRRKLQKHLLHAVAVLAHHYHPVLRRYRHHHRKIRQMIDIKGGNDHAARQLAGAGAHINP